MTQARQSSSQLQIQFGGRSLAGARAQNQDAFLLKNPAQNHALSQELKHKGIVACIADGASCSAQGQKASATACMQFISDYYATPDLWSTRRSASTVLTALNQWLFARSQQPAFEHDQLITTFSAVILKSNTAHLLHVGDTRIYRLRDGQLQQLTRDHRRSALGQSAYLTRALGIDNTLEIDYQRLDLQLGDRFLLSSDGVHDVLSQAKLTELLHSPQSSLETLAEQLCEAAIRQGSQDNLTALLFDITALPSKSRPEHQAHYLSRPIPIVLEPEQILEGYKVVKVLHSGTRSHVYQVLELATARTLVLKAPSPHYQDDVDTLRQFANEAWVGQQLNHPRILKTYPTPNSQFLYLLCEWVDGISLRQWMQQNPWPDLTRTRAILSEIIKAVRVLQRADLVHRDLKPENVMITTTGAIKLIDLGAVQSAGLDEQNLSHGKTSNDDVPLGALHYLAPEYLQSGQASTLSDLFSVAVIGYEMLCGSLPYHTAHQHDLAKARQRPYRYIPLANVRAELPTWLDAALAKGCHPDPKQRHQALSEFVLDLNRPNPELLQAHHRQRRYQPNPLLRWKLLAIAASALAMVQSLFLLGWLD